jgi:4-hydroxy 2-oxovalerate aldolase
MKLELLDCTLRDGGYINDWEFGQDTLVNVFERVCSSGVEFIELGFLDDRRVFDVNRSIMPDTACMEKIYGGLPKGNTKLMGMIDFGTCSIEHIQPCSDSILDGIRVIFKKHLREPAMAFCKQLKELGYIVFSQLVSITSYEDEELMDLIRLANTVKPYAVSMVDTYGLMHKSKLFHYYDILNDNLSPEIAIGYHAHNNFQLGYANCIEMLERHKGCERPILVDGTIYGMGKSAGNAPTELLAMYMNANFGKHYDVGMMLEAIDSSLMDIFKVTPWGYTMKFFIAASNDCHPNYVSYLLDKKTLPVKSINEILKGLKGDKKLLYDKDLIEQLYVEYQRNYCDDEVAYKGLAKELVGKPIMVLGPGVSIVEEADKISSFVEAQNPIVIAINYCPSMWHPDYLFLTNYKRYIQMASSIARNREEYKLIATSNITRASGKFDFTFDYESLIDRNAVFMDNSFLMLLRVLCKVGVKEVYLAGFDGYSIDKESNYFLSKMEYEFSKQKGEEINSDVNRFLAEIKDRISVYFLTHTEYRA